MELLEDDVPHGHRHGAEEAREEGDLRENAGYDAARERQGLLEARISHIESRMIRFDVIDIDMLQSDRVVFGATVTLEDLDSGESRTYTLLGPDEADHTRGTISIESWSVRSARLSVLAS